MRIVFMGTPQFALPSLQMLAESGQDIVAVISQPDREKNKKGELLYTPVKSLAQKLGLDFYAFEKVSVQGLELLDSLKPDLIVTAAFGQLLSQRVLDSARLGVFNVHASLLPRHRGSSPIHSAILCGDKLTGVTIMKTVLKMDAGDMLASVAVPVTDETTYQSLHDTLAELGARLLVETVEKAERGTLTPVAQKDDEATYTKKITKADGLVDFSKPARAVLRQINALYPWPCGYTYFGGRLIKLHKAAVLPATRAENFRPGEVISANRNGVCVRCGEDAINILALQAAGKNVLAAGEFLLGFKIKTGERFETSETTDE